MEYVGGVEAKIGLYSVVYELVLIVMTHQRPKLGGLCL